MLARAHASVRGAYLQRGKENTLSSETRESTPLVRASLAMRSTTDMRAVPTSTLVVPPLFLVFATRWDSRTGTSKGPSSAPPVSEAGVSI